MANRIEQQLVALTDFFRGKLESSESKNYILGFIFYKYLSERALKNVVSLAGKTFEEFELKNRQVQLYRQFINSNESELVNSIGYSIEPDYLFSEIIKENESEQAHNLKMAFNELSGKYKQFEGIFDNIVLESRQLGANSKQRATFIAEIIEKVDQLDISGEDDSIGEGFETIIDFFASEAGRKGDEFYTPEMVSDLVAKIVNVEKELKEECTIYDPTMGSASLMLRVGKYQKDVSVIKYYGQELNTNTYNLARMNLLIHGVDNQNIDVSNGNTLAEDWPTRKPNQFDVIVMNPPYSAQWAPGDLAMSDKRFKSYGVLAPKSKADFAFLLHGLYHLKESGIMAIILPHGILFRGAAEAAIRKKLLEEGSIYAVIGLPPNLFFGTSIPTTLLILKKRKISKDVLFIDASEEFLKGKNQNKLVNEKVTKIVNAIRERESIDKFAYLADFDEITDNDYNLNIRRYVDTFIEEQTIDLGQIDIELAKIKERKMSIENNIVQLISEINVNTEEKKLINKIFGTIDSQE